jgi:hypothetical protein
LLLGIVFVEQAKDNADTLLQFLVREVIADKQDFASDSVLQS